MTAESQRRFSPTLLSNLQYSGMISNLLYNWPIFGGALFFGVVACLVGAWLPPPWRWFLIVGGIGALGLIVTILTASFIVYDWGRCHEYDRLAELGNLAQAKVVIDITCGKLRGTRGLLSHFQHGYYFLIDIYDAEKMADNALRRARAMEPPLQSPLRIHRRAARPDNIPLPHNWADIVYCSFSLHELQDAADREALFAEFVRILKPDGRLLIAEHRRDLLNFATFGPGVLSFFSAKTWRQHLTQAGLTIQHHERWRGLVDLWVAGRKLG